MTGAAQDGTPKRGGWALARRIATRVVQLGIVALLLGVIAVVLVIRHYEADLPSVAQLRRGYEPPQVTRIFARDGTLLANLFTERRTVIPLGDVPNHAKLAFLAAEDANFYEHRGLDYLGMLRALVVNLKAGRTVQGGSTITQQVIKNVVLVPERTYDRKMKETLLARRVEQHLTKDEIFSMYLNHIYLGHGRWGVEEGARYYFGKPAKELDLSEAALLAGLVASPERFSPRKGVDGALRRRAYVLGQMLDKGFVTRELFDAASAAPVRLAPAVEAESQLAPEVVGFVRGLLHRTVGERARLGGYQITTTIDPGLQAAARKAVRDGLDRYAERQKLAPPFTLPKRKLWKAPFDGTPAVNRIYTGVVTAHDDATNHLEVRVGNATGRVALAREERYDPRRLPPSQFASVGAALRVSVLGTPTEAEPVPLRLELGPQAALVAVDPGKRHVLALVGGYEGITGGLDRALDARRQPGSAFKPFVYGHALSSRRFTAASLVEIVPPAGYDAARGPARLSVREALAVSDNSAAQRIFRESGPANVVQWARAAGIESPMEPNDSLALGAYEVSPMELTNAFATFASGGEFASPVLVTRIVGPDGKDVELPASPPTRRVMAPEEAYLVTSLMRSVVSRGTGKRAAVLGRPIAGKTGTTNQSKDAWFVGYSTEIVAGVWVGYDDALPLGWGEQGSSTAVPIFTEFMASAHARRPVTEFPRPPGIVVVSIDPATGLLAYAGQSDAVDEEFLDGTSPATAASPDAGTPEDGSTENGDVTAPTWIEETPVVGQDAGPLFPFVLDAGHSTRDDPPPF